MSSSLNKHDLQSSSTSRLDEINKQLPLRQQTEKPVLKTENGDGRNKYSIEQQIAAAKNNYYNHSKPISPASPAHHFFSNYMYMSGSNGGNVPLTPAHILASSFAINAKNSNPYARPISANDLQCQSNTPTNYNQQKSSQKQVESAMQTNSFLRPQSTINKPTEGHQKESQGQNRKRTPAATTIVDGPELVENGHGSTNHPQQQDCKPKSNGAGDSQSLTPRPPPTEPKERPARPPTPITHKPPPHKPENSKPMAATPRTLIINKPPTPPTNGAKFRNLSYTPTKPYSEIVANHLQTIQRLQNNSKVPTSAADSDTNNNKVHKTPRSKPPPESERDLIKKNSVSEMLKDGSLKKMPVTNTITGTVYYRKSSKGEAVIQKTMKVVEVKQASKENLESEEEEEEVERKGKALKRESSFVSQKSGLDIEDVVDEDCMDALEDDDLGESDEDNSDGYSIRTGTSSASSQRSIRPRSVLQGMASLGLADKKRPVTAKCGSSSSGRVSVDIEPQPSLMASLFPNIPPTVNFVLDGQRVELLPWELRKLLKWKMSPITPNVIKNCIARSGFRATKKNYDWIGYWGKHMKAPGFKTIREYQKFNHFPGSFQIGRKDRLWRNLSHMQVLHSKKDFNFIPQTFCLPQDLKQLKRVWEDGGNKLKWIIKPPASARGIGIKVIHKWNQVPKKRPVIVQRYLSRPYLINESKFDLRIYVYVTSYDPLRIYLYDDGLTRFASSKYSSSMKNLSNKYMHLTNYSINKRNTEYESNTDETVCQGHKWGLKPLWGYLRKQGVNTNTLWENIKDVVVKTIICSESCINSLVKSNVKRKYSVHELFGFDIMFDENLKPWVIEVNISPSLHSNSQLDMNIKGGMVKDLLNICGFVLPDKADVTTSGVIEEDNRLNGSQNPLCMDHRLHPNVIPSDERAKHAYYCQRHHDHAAMQSILDILTPTDIRILTETIDEDSRRGNFQRIFPSTTSHKYLKYFEQPRYFNLLLDQWIHKYNRMEARGVAYLESLCMKNLHLQNPTDDPKHQWTPPNFSIPRDIRVVSAPLNPKNAATLPTVKKSKSVKSMMSSGSSNRSTVTSSSTDISSSTS